MMHATHVLVTVTVHGKRGTCMTISSIFEHDTGILLAPIVGHDKQVMGNVVGGADPPFGAENLRQRDPRLGL